MVGLLRRCPTWALVAGAIAVTIVVVLGFVSSLWVGLALIAITALGLAAWWAWVELPNAYGHGPDRAELAERERWRRMMEGE